MIRPFQQDLMTAEVANEPPYFSLQFVEKQMQIVGNENHEIPKCEFLLGKIENEISKKNCEEGEEN